MNRINGRFCHAPIAALFALSSMILSTLCAGAASSVLTQNNNNERTGADTSETTLTPTNVSVNTFGKLFTLQLDANVNGQVLYVPNVKIKGVTHNIVVAYTSNNSNGSSCSLYAYDADSATQTAPLWRHQFTNSAEWTTCTPVIDATKRIVYVVTKDTNDDGPTNLRAISLLTGEEKTGSPITVAASLPGTGAGSTNGTVSFDTTHANCRPGLLLLNGNVYIAFAHDTDSFPYHGWVMGYNYDGAAFTQTAVFCTDPNGSEGGIWQAGKGLAADSAGKIYLGVGNGTFDVNTGGSSYGMSYVKLNTPDLSVDDWFCPFDEQSSSNSDYDLNNSGPLGIPGTDRIFAGGTKFGSAFVIDTSNMGHFNSGGPDQVVNRVDNLMSNSNVGQNPVCWNAGANKYIYLWPSNTGLMQFKYVTSKGALVPAGIYKQSSSLTAGGALEVTANGTTNGILWAQGKDNEFHAFDALDVTKPELWNSGMNSSRDGLGSTGHWQFPTIVNGKAYVPTGSATIVVYGLLPD